MHGCFIYSFVSYSGGSGKRIQGAIVMLSSPIGNKVLPSKCYLLARRPVQRKTYWAKDILLKTTVIYRIPSDQQFSLNLNLSVKAIIECLM